MLTNAYPFSPRKSEMDHEETEDFPMLTNAENPASISHKFSCVPDDEFQYSWNLWTHDDPDQIVWRYSCNKTARMDNSHDLDTALEENPLEGLSPKSGYIIFREGLAPDWEAEDLIEGEIIRFKVNGKTMKDLGGGINQVWRDLATSLIKEDLQDVRSGRRIVAGCSVNFRDFAGECYGFSVWTQQVLNKWELDHLIGTLKSFPWMAHATKLQRRTNFRPYITGLYLKNFPTR